MLPEPTAPDLITGYPLPEILVSPTEPRSFINLLTRAGFAPRVSSTPEELGVDFAWSISSGWCGVQRKQFPGDFINSIHDGRLAEERSSMTTIDPPLEVAVLVLEGRPMWAGIADSVSGSEQMLMDARHKWSRTQHRNYLASVMDQGIQVHTTDSIGDTVDLISSLHSWSHKPRHNSGDYRPHTHSQAPVLPGPWAQISNRDYQSYILQSLPRTGPVTANAILDHLGFPLVLVATDEELLEVPGVGPGWVEKTRKVFTERFMPANPFAKPPDKDKQT